MPDVQSLTAELNTVLTDASASRRTTMLQQVTVLFLEGAESFTNEQLALFDTVFMALSKNTERKALIELSSRLTAANIAPPDIVKRLACDDDIAVAGPVLKSFDALFDDDVIEIGAKKGAAHLVAIADRQSITEPITDVLIGRAVPETSRKIVANQGARISHLGFVKLLNAAKTDRQLAEMVASRADLPDELQPFIKMILEKP